MINIIPYEKNQKKHPQKQLTQIANSLRRFGWQQPIKVGNDGVILVGHGRWLAYNQDKEGIKEPWIIDNKGNTISGEAETKVLTLSEEKAYRLADNKLNESDWDMDLVIEELKDLNLKGFDIDLTGFSSDLLIEPEDKDDVIPEDVPSIAQLGDIWQLGAHKVMCGSSTNKTDVEALMNGELCELVWTDPPYNVDYEGGTGLKIQNDNMDDNTFYKFLFDFYTQTKNIMHEGAPIYVAHADSEGVNFRKALKDAGVDVKQCIIWVKSSLVMGRQDYQWQHEPILYGWKPGAAHRWYGMFDKTTVIDDEVNIKHLKKEQLQELVQHLRNERKTTVIRVKKPNRNAEHPTMKPVGLITKFIMNSSKQGDTIYDGFGGSGSTLIAAEKLNRKCYMMELDPKYVDVIIKRWEDYTGETAHKLQD